MVFFQQERCGTIDNAGISSPQHDQTLGLGSIALTVGTSLSGANGSRPPERKNMGWARLESIPHSNMVKKNHVLNDFLARKQVPP